MKRNIIILALGLYSLATMAQPDVKPLVQQKLAQLDQMTGTWKGTGYIYTPNGKESSEVTENISYKLDNTIMMMEGRGVKVMEDGTEKVVHDAIGILSFNPFTQAYQMNSFISKGMSTMAQLKIEDDGKVIWWFEAGPATIRYSLTIQDNVWTEIGERSADNENWQKFFEMTLNRVM